MENNNQYFDVDSVEYPAPGSNPSPSGRKRGSDGFFTGAMFGAMVTMLVVCVIYLGVTIGGQIQKRSQESQEPQDRTQEEEGLLSSKVVQKIETLEELIDRMFYLHEVTDEELTEGIYRGMLKALDDPYSVYYTKEEVEELQMSTAGIYYGIGAYIMFDKEGNSTKISSVMPDSPAERAGLRANDLIYAIDGESIYGMQTSDSVKLIKGEENTEVVLSILRDGERMDVTVIRGKVETPTVVSRMLEDRMGYIQIVEFDDVTSGQFENALKDLKSQGMKGLILDLRQNPGGNLDTVVEIGEMLLPKGLIVYTEDKNGKREEYRSNGKHEIDIPMTVLVDMNSASAAEILAGAIQDYKKGTLIGTTTDGKGIVQAVRSLRDGSAVKITISSYFTPNGRNIHGVGIEPDIICEFDGETYYSTEGEVDNQLNKAKEVLAEMMK